MCLLLSAQDPWFQPQMKYLLSQGRVFHPNIRYLLHLLVFEEELLLKRGFSSKVVKTLLYSCKKVTQSIYSKVWKK